MSSIKDLISLDGRAVAITGATGNLGLVMANTIAELGGEVILIDKKDSEFKKLEAEITKKWNVPCVSYTCDLEFEKARNKLIQSIIQNS